MVYFPYWPLGVRLDGAKEGYKISPSGLDALRRVRSTLGKNTPYPVVTRTWGRNLESFCLPAVVCFDPISQMGTSCWCTQCNSELKRDTNTDSWYHRTFRLYGLQSAHLLFSFNYVCPNKQCVVKTCVAHRSKLSKLAATYFPYLILDEFGISFDVMNWLQDAVLSGQSFREFCFQLGRRYDEDATRCEMQFKEYKKRFLANAACTISFTADTEILKSMRHVPSDDTLRRAMFERFWKVERFYRSQMAILPACRLSADHTFKVVVNVGYWERVRTATGMRWKWRPQYSALYIALNELGQVMTWCLCRDQKHETATPYLKDLAQRAGEVIIFVTDDCCKDRGWIQSIFGPNCKVYQDTFHLVQRLARSVNKRHQFGWSAIGKLQNILQGPATRDELEERLDNWMKTFEETGVITLLVKRAVAAAKRHIRKGCLDYLGTGTQPNEGLHRWMRKALWRGRQGIAVAHMLFTLYFHARNYKIGENVGQGLLYRTPEHAAAAGFQVPSECPNFGAWKHCACNNDNKDENGIVAVAPNEVVEHIEFGYGFCGGGARAVSALIPAPRRLKSP